MHPKKLIYGLIDPRTRAIRYIGQSTRGLLRPAEHKYKLVDSDTTHKANWIRALLHEGLDYEIVVLQYLRDDQPYEDIDAMEICWIAHGRAEGWPLTNHTDGGGGIRGYCLSDETRARMGEASKQRWQDPGFRDKQLAERAARRGVPRTPEVRKKISEGKKGYRHTPEAIAKMSAAKRGKPGHVQTAAEIEKRRLTLFGNQRGRKHHKNTNGDSP